MIIYVIYYQGLVWNQVRADKQSVSVYSVNCVRNLLYRLGTQRLNHLTLLFSIPHGENGLWHSLLLHPPH